MYRFETLQEKRKLFDKKNEWGNYSLIRIDIFEM